LACFLYESVLMFAVIFACGLAYALLTNQRDAMQGRTNLMLAAFVVVPGVYFIWYWSQTGQTLAMQTWHLRLVRKDGGRVSRLQALARYAASWVWFLPALALSSQAGWAHSGYRTMAAVVAGIVGYALLSFLMPGRQFVHDMACGTRLVNSFPAPRP
jgi:uncharacterized RDD family membrane protein YckC